MISALAFILQFVLYTWMKIRNKMIDEEWKFKRAFRYYASFRCLFPTKGVILFKSKQRKNRKIKKI